MSFDIPSNLLVPGIGKGLNSDKKIVLFYGWRDGGKSTSLAKALIPKLLLDPHFRGVHVRKHYNEISQSTFTNLSDRINEWGVQDFVDITKDHFKFIANRNPNNFIFGAGADNPDKIRSTQDLNLVWFEEFHDASQQDFESIMGTIREKKGFDTKFYATFNNDKVTEGSFIDKTFFSPESPIYDQVERIHISWRNNPFIDQELTEKKLRLITLGDDDRFRLLDSGAFVTEGLGSYYPEYSNKLVDLSIDYEKDYPIILSFDFNYEPCSMVFCQHVTRKGGGFHVLDELQVDGGTKPLIMAVKRKLDQMGWTGGLRVTGDASGHKHDTRSGSVTDFDIIRNELNIPKSWINFNNTYNQNLGSSRDIINMAFYEQIIKFKNVPNLLRDIRIAKPKDGGSDFDKGTGFDKNRGVFKMDLLDAFRYAYHFDFKSIKDIERFKLVYQQ